MSALSTRLGKAVIIMAKGALGKLAKLSPMSVDWESVPGTSPSVFTSSDVAAALSASYGLSYGARQLAFMLIGDVDAGAKLRLAVVSELGWKCELEGRKEDTQKLNGLAISAIKEFIALQKCQQCRGSGKVIAHAKPDLITRDTGDRKPGVRVRRYATCEKCDGHGVIRWSARRAAKEAGLTRQTYGRRYRDLRETGYQSLVSWLLELTAHLKTHLHYS